ncbi:hypothetical protein E2562_030408 [Oryza meyeriana var. granulata]|uniref:Uncharacterized protein n=1 Tax=Oryza meyeriana var. granulata TaxID=110450 RepID=A0A6G1FE22_9ORYZ|nr:hypothetical protein E2562_030408 [Oryza meyeriana var. granulata]
MGRGKSKESKKSSEKANAEGKGKRKDRGKKRSAVTGMESRSIHPAILEAQLHQMLRECCVQGFPYNLGEVITPPPAKHHDSISMVVIWGYQLPLSTSHSPSGKPFSFHSLNPHIWRGISHALDPSNITIFAVFRYHYVELRRREYLLTGDERMLSPSSP